MWEGGGFWQERARNGKVPRRGHASRCSGVSLKQRLGEEQVPEAKARKANSASSVLQQAGMKREGERQVSVFKCQGEAQKLL